MYSYDFDGASLRQDLLDYYGTAAFSGFPAAMMDVFAVERMDDSQLWAQAEKNGFEMDRYISNYNYSACDTPAANFTAIPYVPVYSAADHHKAEIELHFPVYSDAVKSDFYEITDTAQRIIHQLSPDWEYALFRQEIQDFSYQLGKLKKQTPDNPFVKAIGNASTGKNLLFYIVSLADNLSDGIEKAHKAATSAMNSLDSSLNSARKRKDPSMVRDTVIRFMEPYCIFLGMYNDLMLIEQPQDYKVIFSEYRKILKSMLSDCEMFYYYLYTPDQSSGTASTNHISASLDLHGFYTKKIADAVLTNCDALNLCTIQRKTI